MFVVGQSPNWKAPAHTKAAMIAPRPLPEAGNRLHLRIDPTSRSSIEKDVNFTYAQSSDSIFQRICKIQMNLLESQWLGRRLALLPSEALFPLLNVGSSTREFR